MLLIIPNFPNYLVTSEGEIYSLKRNKFLSPSLRSGYEQVILCKYGKRFCRRIHTLVLEAFVGKCPEGMQCRHLDGIKQNNHLSNLCWGTPCENQHDRIKHGTRVNNNGELNPNSVLTEQNVKEIWGLWWTNMYTRTDIAKIYKVTRQTVSNILEGRTWKYI